MDTEDINETTKEKLTESAKKIMLINLPSGVKSAEFIKNQKK